MPFSHFFSAHNNNYEVCVSQKWTLIMATNTAGVGRFFSRNSLIIFCLSHKTDVLFCFAQIFDSSVWIAISFSSIVRRITLTWSAFIEVSVCTCIFVVPIGFPIFCCLAFCYPRRRTQFFKAFTGVPCVLNHIVTTVWVSKYDRVVLSFYDSSPHIEWTLFWHLQVLSDYLVFYSKYRLNWFRNLTFSSQISQSQN